MSKAHHLSPRKHVLSQNVLGVPLNFLLGASDAELDQYELATLAKVADTREEMIEIEDRYHDLIALAGLIRWFRGNDRQTLKAALETEETAEEWAKREIRESQRSPEELIPRASLPPGAAHLAAALRYQERNLAEGKCRYCPKPICRESVDMCTEHLAKSRARDQRKKALSVPGSTEYLYAGEIPSTHGRTPGTMSSLAMSREKKTRALLAERGIKPESAAVSLKAVIEALLKVMPTSKKDAMTQAQLFEKGGVVTKTTGQKALQQLLFTGEIRRIGKGRPLHAPYRYFRESVFGKSLDEAL